MIFSAPRFIVIDDKERHLTAITKVFETLGSPCLGIRYNPAIELDPQHFRCVRCLFMDIHLLEAQATTDHTRHFAVIADLLESNICLSGGPYILVVWTEHPGLRVELEGYLRDRLDPGKPYLIPMAVLGLSKADFINLADGNAANPTALRDAIQAKILEVPQLAALLSWETDVLTAAGATLASLVELVPAAQRNAAGFGESLNTILSRLAVESVGQANVDADPRGALAQVLAPLLSDRVINQERAESVELWKAAVTRHNDPELGGVGAEEAGRINRMLHVALPSGEGIRATDLGAVVNWPWDANELERRFGIAQNQLFGAEFKIERTGRAGCVPVLIRLGAACDFAQDRAGPLPYLFGYLIPEAADRKRTPQGEVVKLGDAIWRSPLLEIPGIAGSARLHVHFRLPVVATRTEAAAWTVRFRLREQLLMQLSISAGTYGFRPGIVQLSG